MEKHYTMKEASKILGVTVKTLQRWDKEGKIRCIRTVGGRRRIPESEIKRILGLREERKVVGYARVSGKSERRKEDLKRQVEVIKEYSKRLGIEEIEVIKDVGSGLNENRKGFQKLLDLVLNNEVSKVIITHKDRLTRFGFETLKRIFEKHGTEIVVIYDKDSNSKEELVEDLITIIAHFAGKLYGTRSHKYKKVVEDAKKLIQDC